MTKELQNYLIWLTDKLRYQNDNQKGKREKEQKSIENGNKRMRLDRTSEVYIMKAYLYSKCTIAL